MAKEEKFQCTHLVAPGRMCIMKEGHDGPCYAGKMSPTGAVCDCPFCGMKFATFPEFDAHAPCPAS
jgi:hypothetical protein